MIRPSTGKLKLIIMMITLTREVLDMTKSQVNDPDGS